MNSEQYQLGYRDGTAGQCTVDPDWSAEDQASYWDGVSDAASEAINAQLERMEARKRETP